ncbi:MAG: hypothetical protein IJT12_06770 [Paludibacteraceae bacterium]|nr:hypothetical protein [Paludibacteraceae bacterium]
MTVLFAAALFVAVPLPVSAQEVDDIDDAEAVEAVADTLLAEADTLVADPDPEWYVAPVEPVFGNAPRRSTAAAACPTDSVVTYDVDGNFAEVTCYYYDEAGNTVRTEAWTYSDGKRIGTTKQEFEFNAKGVQVMTAAYTWDNTTGNWKGAEKTEDVYNASNKMESRTISDWVNGAWLPKTRYTYAYDASNREIEYITYARNASNELVKSKGRIREYNAKGKTTLDIQYTAYANGAWTAGTKKVYDFDASGNQVLYEYYSSLSNGNWVGSSREVWEYTSGKKMYYAKQTWSNGWVNSSKETWEYNGPSAKQTYYEKDVWSNGAWIGSAKELWEFNAKGSQTLHEKYGWANSDWAVSLQENWGYDAAGNNTLVENYSYTNGVKKGSKKEEYAFNAAKKKTLTLKYIWSNNDWAYNAKAVTDYDAAGNTIETASYNWVNEAWQGAGTRTLQTFNSSKKVTEKITQTWSTTTNDWVNKTRATTEYSGAKTIQEASYTWQNDAWVGTSRSDWSYNAAGLNDTIKTYTDDGTGWIYSKRTVNTYNAAGENIMTHNSQWNGSAWVLVSMTRLDKVTDAAGNILLNASWKCGSDSVWIGVSKDVTEYSSTGKVLFIGHYESWANNDWVPNYTVEYKYDEADRVTLNQRMDWKNNTWQGLYRYEYVYDAEGRKVSSATYNGWNTSTNSWVGTVKTETVYNASGQTSSLLNYTWSNNAWAILNKTLFEYDAANNVTEQVVQNYSNGEWVNVTRYEKEYSGSQLVKSNDYTWSNDAWQYTRRSEKTYDNDAQAKLRREISGSWTNGELNSFTDNYYYYNCDPHAYAITFNNEDGTLLASAEVLEGEIPTYTGATPTKPADAQYTYTFAGWDKEIVAVTGATTYTATFNATLRKYTVTFANEDGTTIEAKDWEYGATPVAPADPTKDATAQYTYTFAGWDKEIVAVTGEATYKATFTATVNKYTVTFQNEDGTTIEAKEWEYGATPIAPADPTKEATAQYTYTFAGWDKEIATVTGEATYKATFTTTVNKYTITFANEDGTTIEAKEWEYGATPVAPADPTKDATAQYTYTFAGWDKEIATVTGEATYKATFTATVNKYTVTFQNEDGTTIEAKEYEYGATPVAPADPTKDATAQYTYTFAGWDNEIVAVTGEATYKATFTATVNKYTITFQNEDGTTIEAKEWEYGATPVAPSDPTKDATAQYTYTFAGWDNEIVAVTGEATYKATFTATTCTYTITWVDGDGKTILTEQVAYGETPAYAGATPTKTATDEYTYEFSNAWSPAIEPVTGDATYTALFTETAVTPSTYTITYVDDEGNVLFYEVYTHGQTPDPATPGKESTAQYDYTFSGWSPAIVPATSDATYQATFTATVRSYTITFVNEDGTVLYSEVLEYGQTPEYVGETPVKAEDQNYTYTFSGWTPEIGMVEGAATYTATYTAVEKHGTGMTDVDGEAPATKVMENGVLYIIRAGQKYTSTGAPVQ